MTTTSRSHDVERSRRQKRYQETSRNGGKSRITFQEDNKKNRQYFTHLYIFNFNVITHFFTMATFINFTAITVTPLIS